MRDVDWGHVALIVAVIVPSVILHEVSHGWAALRLGDDTAKRRGRLTLNPIAHVDPVGTILLPAVLAAIGLGVIGFAKPVPVNVARLRRPRDHAVVVALAGPATNLVLAAVAVVGLRLLGPERVLEGAIEWTPASVLYVFGAINVLLAAFNLLPLPPLDGSAVVERLLPSRWLPGWYRLRRWSIVVLIAFFLLVGSAAGGIFDPVLDLWDDLVL